MEIKIDKLKKSFDKKLILDIESLTLEKEKITSIIGANGVGKSTLLNIIAGLDREYTGEIKYDNKLLNKDLKRDISLIFQTPYLFRRSVYENIEYPLKIRNIGKKKRKQLVLDIINRLEIEDLKDKLAHKLSGGESQKVALARSLIFKPRLLLLDEPTSNIDSESIKIMEREILKFHRETQASIIIVTHNKEQSNRLSDNILELK